MILLKIKIRLSTPLALALLSTVRLYQDILSLPSKMKFISNNLYAIKDLHKEFAFSQFSVS